MSAAVPETTAGTEDELGPVTEAEFNEAFRVEEFKLDIAWTLDQIKVPPARKTKPKAKRKTPPSP